MDFHKIICFYFIYRRLLFDFENVQCYHPNMRNGNTTQLTKNVVRINEKYSYLFNNEFSGGITVQTKQVMYVNEL